MKKEPGKIYEGVMDASGMRFALVCSRFNEFFVGKLLEGAVDVLTRHGAKSGDIEAAWVPGSYEIPTVVSRLIEHGEYDAVIALGVVIQGGTSHASNVYAEVSKCLAQISLQNSCPVVNGVVTVNDIEQAIERSGTKAGNRGADAAKTAVEMANLMRVLPGAK